MNTMSSVLMSKFKDIWAVDCEFRSREGNLPDKVVCIVAKELSSGTTKRWWEDELETISNLPALFGKDSCVVAYGIHAELSCFKTLGWDYPENSINLLVEFKNVINGLVGIPTKYPSLIEALNYYGISGFSEEGKQRMRDLILYKENYTEDEKQRILVYCESDVVALEKIFPIITCSNAI